MEEYIKNYRSMRDAWKTWTAAHYSVKRKSKRRKTPWYTITSGKQYRYEQRTQSWGEMTSYFRIKSEAQIFHEKTIAKKMTAEKYKMLLIEAKLSDWEKKHPQPVQPPTKDNPQMDLFEKEFNLMWENEREEVHKKIVKFVENIGNRAKVYARYNNNAHVVEIMNIKSDGCSFMLNNGAYTNYNSPNIRKVQRAADLLYKFNPSLIALKIVDKDQECIIIPKVAA